VTSDPHEANSYLGYDANSNPVHNTAHYPAYSNIRIHDPRPQRVFLRFNSHNKTDLGSSPGPARGILFQNITMPNRTLPDIEAFFWGHPSRR
jgi:hypothetical protein